MSMSLEAPLGFFPTSGLTTFNLDEPPQKKEPSTKFSFSSIMSKTPKKAIVTTNIEQEDLNIPITPYNSQKIDYSSLHFLKPRFNENSKRIINWGDLIQIKDKNDKQNKEQKRIEEQQKNDLIKSKEQSKTDVMDFFNDTETISIVVEEKKSVLTEKIANVIDTLSGAEILGKKDKSQPLNAMLPDQFFDLLYNSFQFMNPEERGKLLVTIIFGGLITRPKMTGIGGKKAFVKFDDLLKNLNKLPTGGMNSSVGRVYTTMTEIIVSARLNRYRSELTAAEHIVNVTSLVNRLVQSKQDVYFPSNYLFSDPVFTGIDPGTNLKSVPISGVPTLDNFTDFFSTTTQQVIPPVVVQKKKVTKKLAFDENDSQYIRRTRNGDEEDW